MANFSEEEIEAIREMTIKAYIEDVRKVYPAASNEATIEAAHALYELYTEAIRLGGIERATAAEAAQLVNGIVGAGTPPVTERERPRFAVPPPSGQRPPRAGDGLRDRGLRRWISRGRCTGCGGSGRCVVCGGGGRERDWWGLTRRCQNCRGNGRCPTCRGTGRSR